MIKQYMTKESAISMKKIAEEQLILAELYAEDEGLEDFIDEAEHFHRSMDEVASEMYTEAHEALRLHDKQAEGAWDVGVQLLKIEHGIDDTAIIREPNGIISEHDILFRFVDEMDEDEAEIREDGAPYIQLGEYDDGMKLFFDECVRV